MTDFIQIDAAPEDVNRRLIRVFPRITKATPQDELARFGPPNLFDEADEIRGVNLCRGATSRMGTHSRRGDARAAAGSVLCGSVIQDGWNILDDNLLACPEPHVRAVFKMLARQGRQIEFTGGLEARAMEDYQVGLLADMKPRPNCFFAYDPGDPFETLKSAADRLIAAGFTACSHRLRCYVLIGYPKDTFALADKRLNDMMAIGFTPHAMLWQPEVKAAEKHRPAPEWKKFQRTWARPAIIHASRHSAGQ